MDEDTTLHDRVTALEEKAAAPTYRPGYCHNPACTQYGVELNAAAGAKDGCTGHVDGQPCKGPLTATPPG